jgi:hypothetical protein
MIEQIVVRSYDKRSDGGYNYLHAYLKAGFIVKHVTPMNGYIEYILEKKKNL